MMMMIKSSAYLAAILFVLSATPAHDQVPCSRWTFNNTTGASGPNEVVPAVPGERIYLCGYAVMASSNALDFQLFSAGGPGCTSLIEISPLWKLATGSSLVNRIPAAAGERTATGHALCIQTFGTGELHGVIYWHQAP